MRVLLTGGAGFIGSHVADALLAAGHEVQIVDDLSSGRAENLPPGARFDRLDLRDGAGVARVFAEFRPEALCHQAAQTSVSRSTREPVFDAEVNVIGSLHLLQAAAAQKTTRIVFASTGGAIYGEVAPGTRAAEEHALRPLSPYGCSKLAVEGYLQGYAQSHGFEVRVLRYANVYGPRQDPHGEAGVVAIFAERLLRGEALQINAMRESGDAGCIRDYVFVADVVRANLAALEGRLAEPVLNVGSGVGTGTRELAEQMQAILGTRAPLRSGPRREGDLERSVLDPTRFERALGAPTDLREGLARTLDAFRSRAATR